MRLFSADKAQLQIEAQAWNNAMALRAKRGWWNEPPFSDFTSGSQDWLSQRMYADTNRLMMAPARVELWHWRPEGGAVAVRISELPESHCIEYDLPCPGYYQVDFFLNQAAGRWEPHVLAWNCLAGHRVGIAQLSAVAHRYDPTRAPDAQPKPGSAVFAVVDKTTKDFTVVFNDFNGFSVDRPYGQHDCDLIALLA